jgi:hypothetical protein
MPILDLLLGRPLASDEARAEQVGASAGIPIFGLDALSSAAYGPEAALTLLIQHHRTADNRLFFLSPDHRGLSRWRRVVYGCAPKPWRLRGPPGCGCSSD